MLHDHIGIGLDKNCAIKFLILQLLFPDKFISMQKNLVRNVCYVLVLYWIFFWYGDTVRWKVETHKRRKSSALIARFLWVFTLIRTVFPYPKNVQGETSTPKTGFSEPQFSEPWFSEIHDLMNKLQLPISYFTLYPDSI